MLNEINEIAAYSWWTLSGNYGTGLAGSMRMVGMDGNLLGPGRALLSPTMGMASRVLAAACANASDQAPLPPPPLPTYPPARPSPPLPARPLTFATPGSSPPRLIAHRLPRHLQLVVPWSLVHLGHEVLLVLRVPKVSRMRQATSTPIPSCPVATLPSSHSPASCRRHSHEAATNAPSASPSLSEPLSRAAPGSPPRCPPQPQLTPPCPSSVALPTSCREVSVPTCYCLSMVVRWSSASGIVSVHPLQVAEAPRQLRPWATPSSPFAAHPSAPPPTRPPSPLPLQPPCDQSHQCHLQVFLLSYHLCHLGWDNPTRLRFQSHSPRQQRKSDRFLAWQQHRRQAVRATMRTSPW